MIAFVVGLKAEARLLKGASVFIGGGDAAGAEIAAKRAMDAGATGLISFGLAGGLQPGLAAGALVIPRRVMWRDVSYAADPALAGAFTCDVLLGAEQVVVTAHDKAALFATTGADAADLESGPVAALAARRGLAFAVVRAVCDPAERTLPPASLIALNSQGSIVLPRMLLDIGRAPRQIPALLRLAQDAGRARKTLLDWASKKAVLFGPAEGVLRARQKNQKTFIN